jgi:CxxC-x17-CxxC domain-containing protein
LYTDKTLVCADCGQEFLFTASEQEFYAARQFSEPRRCGSCRAIRKAQRGGDSAGYSASGGGYGNGGGYGSRGGYGGGGGYGGSRGPREMFDVICSNCGKEAQVPFRPTSGKPVYCNDCFAARRA